jgi:hypothetical protein
MALYLYGCSSVSAPAKSHAMGEPVQAGGLVYTVTEADWRNELSGTTAGIVRAKNRFLVLKITISNSASQELSVPLLHLEDASGNTFEELEEVDGVDNWLGLLRLMSPASHLEGNIVFDVPPAVYSLRVTSSGDPEKETHALIEIPLQASKPQPSPEEKQ